MAFIYRDFTGPLFQNFVNNTGIYNQFKKVWPLDPRDPRWYARGIVYYNAGWFREDTSFLRFLNKIGMSIDDLKGEDYDDIEYAYLTLDPGKTPREIDPDPTISKTATSSTLNFNLSVGDKIKVVCTYGGKMEYIINEHEEIWELEGESVNRVVVNTGLNSTEIRNVLLSDRFKYFANILIPGQDRNTYPYVNYASQNLSYDPENEYVSELLSARVPTFVGPFYTPVVATSTERHDGSVLADTSDINMFALAMLDISESCFTVTKNDDGTPKLFDDRVESHTTELPIDSDFPVFDDDGVLIIYDHEDIEYIKSGSATAYTFSYEFTYTGADPDSQLIQDLEYYSSFIMNPDPIEFNDVLNTVQKKDMSVLYTPTVVLESKPGYPTDVYSPVEGTGGWYEYFDNFAGVWYLDVQKAANMPRWEFVNMFSDCLDVDYKVEDASFLERFFAYFIVVLSIVVVIFAPYLAPALSTVNALILGVGYASIILTIGALVLSQMGLSAQHLMKVIAKAAQITGMIAAITGALAAINGAFTRMGAEAAAKGVIKTSADYTIGMFASDVINNVITNVTSSITGVFDLLTSPMKALLGTSTTAAPTTLSGWVGRLQQGMKLYTTFFESSNDNQTATTPNEEQMNKRDFQDPSTMYTTQEKMVYEPDALQKIDILKEQQMGGRKTEELMQRIA